MLKKINVKTTFDGGLLADFSPSFLEFGQDTRDGKGEATASRFAEI
jgi:hypothetical protein